MMVLLTARQEYNLRTALATTDDAAKRLRLAFAIWTESRGLIQANGGLNTSKSPGFDKHPEWPATMRLSLLYPHDAVGNNGRSTGLLQQISSDVGGVWGDMGGTMDPATSARRFLAKLKVTDDPVFRGKLLRTDGTLDPKEITLSDPITADVLRVQQPLANEAASDNYGAANVAIAREIVAQLFPPATSGGTDVLGDIVADRKVVVVIKAQGAQWIVYPLTGIRVRVNDFQAKDQYLAYLRNNCGMGDAIIDRAGPEFVDEDGIYFSTVEVKP